MVAAVRMAIVSSSSPSREEGGREGEEGREGGLVLKERANSENSSTIERKQPMKEVAMAPRLRGEGGREGGREGHVSFLRILCLLTPSSPPPSLPPSLPPYLNMRRVSPTALPPPPIRL